MSFSGDQKNEIMSHPIKTPCCKRAFMQGILSAAATSCDGSIVLSIDNIDRAEFVRQLILEVYNKDAIISTNKNGGRAKLVSFFAKSAEQYLEDFTSGKKVYDLKCPTCEASYLRGVFFGSGRAADPSKQYSLEFSPKTNHERFASLFEDIGLTPRVSVKPREAVIYFKKSAEIEDFFALANMNQATFALMNAKIQSELRNNANRVANCETNNIDKAVSSSMDIVLVIKELMSRGLMSQLPDELEATARMRVDYQDLSLSQLAAKITPPVTKSGLSHRLRKISEIAESLLSRKKK